MVKSYCLKERKVTEGFDPKIIRTKTIELCKSCGIFKYRFIKDH